MVPLPREAARAYVDKLRKDNGGLTKEDREFLEQTRPWILETIDNIRRKLGVSTKTLAEQLYAKDTRFVYELIQNAEDNNYTIANGSSDPPWLRFSLYQDRIEIDSNEDGFSEGNIKAICSIGESTKANTQGYIGEKGIGFKSVFKVACKVHVQSEPYSFAFSHKRDGNDNGLGMVTPMNEPYRVVPDGVRTRMILYLLESCDRAALRKDLLDIPDTLLLFLKKLKKLVIQIDLAGNAPQAQTYSLSSSGDRVTIHKQVGPSAPNSSRSFMTLRRWVSNMPTDIARKNNTNAEVVLAFPLNSDDVPVLEEQHVFAFLPLRKVGYKFLIQSDFIAQASREDVFDNKWNNRLLEEVAEAFMQSVDSFLQHPVLKHRWVRFIPTDPIADDFWGRLQRRIFQALSSRNAFFSRDNRRLMARQLRIIPTQYKDSLEEPLLLDLIDGASAYVSKDYDSALDVPILRKMKASTLSTQDFLDRVKRDLERSRSYIQTNPPSHMDWHGRIAAQLIAAIDSSPSCGQFLRRLPLVPLNNRRWVAPLNASIFFPTSGGMDIPIDLPLSLVDKEALNNETRKKFFGRVGVSECEPVKVFPLIEQQYISSDKTVEKSLAHVKFMFWHHKKLPVQGLNVWLASNKGSSWFKPRGPEQGWTYSPLAKGQYTASTIFQASVPKTLTGMMHFPNSIYYDMLRLCQRRNDQTGVEWFQHFFDIKRGVQLYSRTSTSSPSSEFLHIISQQTESLLGVLEANWLQYSTLAAWDENLENAEVPILNSYQRKRLGSCYLPLPKLRVTVARLGLEEAFGFIKELQDITDLSSVKWSFLSRFGVVMEEDVVFWLALLTQARAKSEVECKVVFEIYANLQKFTAAQDVEKIQEAFQSEVVCIPSTSQPSIATWTTLISCVWRAPEWYTYHDRLSALRDYSTLYSLFVRTLALGNAQTDNFLAYLEHIQSRGIYRVSKAGEEKINLLYRELQEETKDAAVSKKIQARFEEQRLVYYPPSQTWHAPSSCIWAEQSIQLPGKVSLATAYKRQSSFFTQILGIVKPNLQMHILALEQKTVNNPEKEVVIQEMRNICALNPTPEALKKLDECKCFPVKSQSGPVQWRNRSDVFAVIDRRDYGELFKEKMILLDLSLEEVHSIKSFLDAMGLGERYLSVAVKKKTKATDGSLNLSLTEGMRKKSYAICRFSAHFGSMMVKQDPATVQSMLRDMEIYTSCGISVSLTIKQGHQEVTIDQEKAYFHLEQGEGKLKLYVPKSNTQRQVCYATELPITLLNHFGASTLKYAELGAIITAPSISVVNQLLEHSGIIEVVGLEPSDDDSGYDSDETEAEEIATYHSSPVPESASSYNPAPARSSTAPSHDTLSPRESPHVQDSARSIVTATATLRSQETTHTITIQEQIVAQSTVDIGSTRSPSPQLQVNHYRNLLDVLIRQAAQLPALPNVGQTTLSTVVQDRDLDVLLAVESPFVGEREFKIGAAGELFVFEMLKSLALPDFSLDEWQSNIRGRVCIHDRYRNIANWGGPETADLVYHDRRSVLTEMLISKGYLEGAVWRSRTPTYYIEVKSTLGPLETQFFCSQLQVNRMDTMRLSVIDVTSNKIYLIVRVFSLGSISGTGFKIYLDPATLRRRGELEFKADKYTVTAPFKFRI